VLTQDVSYLPPSPAQFTDLAVLLSSTKGGTTFSISGSQFGRDVDGHPIVLFGPVGFMSCNVTVSHVELTCRTVPGIGAAWPLTILIESQYSVPQQWFTLSYRPPTVTAVFSGDATGVDLTRLPTRGLIAPGSALVINGTDFGEATTGADLIVMFGSASAPSTFTAVNCFVSHPHEQLRCDIPPGLGRALGLQVSIKGQVSNFVPNSLSYLPPSIVEVSAALLDTRGGTAVRIDGTNFGYPGNAQTFAAYFHHSGIICTVSVDTRLPFDTAMCTSLPGVGHNHSWVITTGGQASEASPRRTSYAVPLGSHLQTPVLPYSTLGGEQINITGDFFGPAALWNPIRVVAAADVPSVSGVEYELMACNVTTPHIRITCTVPPGVGSRLRAIVW
jgi:hypothetical protein